MRNTNKLRLNSHVRARHFRMTYCNEHRVFDLETQTPSVQARCKVLLFIPVKVSCWKSHFRRGQSAWMRIERPQGRKPCGRDPTRK